MSTTEKKALEFEVYSRQVGTSIAKKLRRDKQVPAVVYGKTQNTIPLSLDIRIAEKYSKREYENKIFTFKSKEKTLDGLKVLKKDTSYHKLTRKPIHIDFLSLDMKQSVRVNVEVLFTGKAKGVKESGGIFNIIRRDVEVECLPANIPDSLSIDVSGLDINQNFHVSDLEIPENVKLITNEKASLCGVSELAEEEVATTTPEAAAAGEAQATTDTTTDTQTTDSKDKDTPADDKTKKEVKK